MPRVRTPFTGPPGELLWTRAPEGGNLDHAVEVSPGVTAIYCAPDPVMGTPDAAPPWVTPSTGAVPNQRFSMFPDFQTLHGGSGARTFRVYRTWGAVLGYRTGPTFAPCWYTRDPTLAIWTRATQTYFSDRTEITIPAGSGGFLRVAEAQPYTTFRYQEDMARWMAFTQYVVRHPLATSVLGEPIYRFTLTNTAIPDSGKEKVYAFDAGHTEERLVPWTMAGMIDYLLAHPALLDDRVWDIVVRLNPDGYVNGWGRTGAGGIAFARFDVTGPNAQTEGPEQSCLHADILARVPKVLAEWHTSVDFAGGFTPVPRSMFVVVAKGTPEAFSTLPVANATFDPGNYYSGTNVNPNALPTGSFPGPFGSTVAGPYRVLKSEGIPHCALFETGAQTDFENGQAATPTTARLIGENFVRMTDEWLKTN